MMEFEWDENKNQMNIEDHGISFEEAKPVFVDDYSLDFEDTSASEVRYNKIGMAYGLILFVVYTIREAEGIFKFVSFLQERQITMKKEVISEIIANGVRNRPEDRQTDWNRLDNMSDEESNQNALKDPDAQPLSEDAQPIVNVKLIRAKLGMTQEEFAKTFQLSLATIRDWEQRRSRPDQAAKTLLRVIERNPKAVEYALKIA